VPDSGKYDKQLAEKEIAGVIFFLPPFTFKLPVGTPSNFVNMLGLGAATSLLQTVAGVVYPGESMSEKISSS
jgi:hypothetical protein